MEESNDGFQRSLSPLEMDLPDKLWLRQSDFSVFLEKKIDLFGSFCNP